MRVKTYQGTIYPWHCDHMGHMNVQFYVAIYDQATWNLFAEIGMDAVYFRNNNKGMAALEQHIFYKCEVLAGENLFVESEIFEVREKIIRFQHRLLKQKDHIIASETQLVGLHMDTQIRKGCPFPDFVSEKASPFLGNE